VSALIISVPEYKPGSFETHIPHRFFGKELISSPDGNSPHEFKKMADSRKIQMVKALWFFMGYTPYKTMTNFMPVTVAYHINNN
jgi:hypothetical protein